MFYKNDSSKNALGIILHETFFEHHITYITHFFSKDYFAYFNFNMSLMPVKIGKKL